MVVTRETYIRELPLSVIRNLALFLDKPMPTHQDWRGMAALLPRRPGAEEMKYSTMQISRFEQVLHRPGGSPTESVLQDWGTTNARVSDLLSVLREMNHCAAMDTLIPGSSLNIKEKKGEEKEDVESPIRHLDEVNVPVQPTAPPMPEEEEEDKPPAIPPRPEPVSSSVDRVQDRRLPQESTDPILPSEALPAFDPQTVHRYSYAELRLMTNDFNTRRVKEGGALIDEGGFGVVFKGRYKGGELCAIKRLKEQKVSELVDIERQFDAELKSLCRLRHPNLVILYGYCYEPSNLCLVYELLTGGSLKDRLACRGNTTTLTSPPLTWPQRLNIAWGAASGIRFLHDMGFIHRDIKSGNILLDANLTARVCDFGLVRDKSNKPSGSTSHYQTEVTIGSTAYMAPEAHFGEYSKLTDVYSFGLVLLEILTGMPVYEETHIISRVDDMMETDDNVLRLIDQQAILWDEESVSSIYDLATRCTEQKPKRRPLMTVVVETLQNLQRGTPAT